MRKGEGRVAEERERMRGRHGGEGESGGNMKERERVGEGMEGGRK